MNHPPGVCLIVMKYDQKANDYMVEHNITHNHVMNHNLAHNVYACTIHECCIEETKNAYCHPNYLHFYARRMHFESARKVLKYTFK